MEVKTYFIREDHNRHEVNEYEYRAYKFGAVKVRWAGDPDEDGNANTHTYLAVTRQLNPNWNPLWPEDDEHREVISSKSKTFCKYLPLKMREFERIEINKKRTDKRIAALSQQEGA